MLPGSGFRPGRHDRGHWGLLISAQWYYGPLNETRHTVRLSWPLVQVPFLWRNQRPISIMTPWHIPSRRTFTRFQDSNAWANIYLASISAWEFISTTVYKRWTYIWDYFYFWFFQWDIFKCFHTHWPAFSLAVLQILTEREQTFICVGVVGIFGRGCFKWYLRPLSFNHKFNSNLQNSLWGGGRKKRKTKSSFASTHRRFNFLWKSI